MSLYRTIFLDDDILHWLLWVSLSSVSSKFFFLACNLLNIILSLPLSLTFIFIILCVHVLSFILPLFLICCFLLSTSSCLYYYPMFQSFIFFCLQFVSPTHLCICSLSLICIPLSALLLCSFFVCLKTVSFCLRLILSCFFHFFSFTFFDFLIYYTVCPPTPVT